MISPYPMRLLVAYIKSAHLRNLEDLPNSNETHIIEIYVAAYVIHLSNPCAENALIQSHNLFAK
jgi:hypothetical protein